MIPTSPNNPVQPNRPPLLPLFSSPNMLAAAFLINALLAGAALAIPSPRERVDKRVARRFAHLSSPRIASELSGTGSVAASNATGPLYSQNWSGSVLVANNVRVWSVSIRRIFD